MINGKKTRILIAVFASNIAHSVNRTLNIVTRAMIPRFDTLQENPIEGTPLDIVRDIGNTSRGWVLEELPHISTNTKAIKQKMCLYDNLLPVKTMDQIRFSLIE